MFALVGRALGALPFAIALAVPVLGFLALLAAALRGLAMLPGLFGS